mmetsp:Transcript_49094/g.126599  ORF Transcript_49094/g.126599 Transcript_49094/m.126599 type:complete len:263 (-) Transcript_49094:1213-2001(-)
MPVLPGQAFGPQHRVPRHRAGEQAAAQRYEEEVDEAPDVRVLEPAAPHQAGDAHGEAGAAAHDPHQVRVLQRELKHQHRPTDVGGAALHRLPHDLREVNQQAALHGIHDEPSRDAGALEVVAPAADAQEGDDGAQGLVQDPAGALDRLLDDVQHRRDGAADRFHGRVDNLPVWHEHVQILDVLAVVLGQFLPELVRGVHKLAGLLSQMRVGLCGLPVHAVPDVPPAPREARRQVAEPALEPAGAALRTGAARGGSVAKPADP